MLVFFFPANFVIASENTEIEYLLSYIAKSNCTFIRNGKDHQAKKASQHLRMKYEHVQGRIKTAEDFIDKIATRSSLTRKPYAIRCAETQMPADRWLTNVLASHRTSENSQQRGNTAQPKALPRLDFKK